MPEINNSSFTGVVRLGSHDNCLEFAKEVKRIGWKVSFGSDAHCIDNLAKFDRSIEIANEAGLTEENIINTSSEMIEKYILRK